jgi:hypothetical protein
MRKEAFSAKNAPRVVLAPPSLLGNRKRSCGPWSRPGSRPQIRPLATDEAHTRSPGCAFAGRDCNEQEATWGKSSCRIGREA